MRTYSATKAVDLYSKNTMFPGMAPDQKPSPPMTPIALIRKSENDGSEVIDVLGTQDPTDQLSHWIDGNSKEWKIWG